MFKKIYKALVNFIKDEPSKEEAFFIEQFQHKPDLLKKHYFKIENNRLKYMRFRTIKYGIPALMAMEIIDLQNLLAEYKQELKPEELNAV